MFQAITSYKAPTILNGRARRLAIQSQRLIKSRNYTQSVMSPTKKI